MSTRSSGALMMAEKLESTMTCSSIGSSPVVFLRTVAVNLGWIGGRRFGVAGLLGVAGLHWSTERSERRAELVGEQLRLFPGREVAALVQLVVVDEVGIRALGPTPRSLILLARKDADGHRDLDAFDVEESALVLPVEARRRDTGIRQPVERYVVEDLVSRELARVARVALQRCTARCR